MATTKQPLVEPDVIIKQSIQPMKCEHLTPCSDPPPPQWDTDINSTPLLESRGVTDQKLQQMVDKLNNFARQDFQTHFNPKLTYIMAIPCFGVIAGIITLIVALDQFTTPNKATIITLSIGPALVIISMFIMLCFLYVVYRSYQKAQIKTCEKVSEWVNKTLNQQVESQRGLHGMIIKTKKKEDVGESVHYHIGIKALNCIIHANGHSDGEEEVVYLDLDGHPVDRQQTLH